MTSVLFLLSVQIHFAGQAMGTNLIMRTPLTMELVQRSTPPPDLPKEAADAYINFDPISSFAKKSRVCSHLVLWTSCY